MLGRSIQPYHKQQGFHATSTCGTIGAAMAVGTALGFSKEQLKNALSAAVKRVVYWKLLMIVLSLKPLISERQR